MVCWLKFSHLIQSVAYNINILEYFLFGFPGVLSIWLCSCIGLWWPDIVSSSILEHFKYSSNPAGYTRIYIHFQSEREKETLFGVGCGSESVCVCESAHCYYKETPVIRVNGCFWAFDCCRTTCEPSHWRRAAKRLLLHAANNLKRRERIIFRPIP